MLSNDNVAYFMAFRFLEYSCVWCKIVSYINLNVLCSLLVEVINMFLKSVSYMAKCCWTVLGRYDKC